MEHKKHKMRDTSLLAYADVLEQLGERQKEVFRVLRELKTANNTMIAEKIGLPINSVVPRIYELRKMGVVIFYKKDLCPITNKKTIFWKCRRDI